MLAELLEQLRDPAIRDGYIFFCMFVLIVPMIGLSRWWSRTIGNSEGARALKRKQEDARPTKGSPRLAEALQMAKEISNGKYGDEVKTIQRTVYLFVFGYILVCGVAFGLLFLSDSLPTP
jgi:Na+-transporting methylmalonyl-CoA/oxaloacetate decarboxylase gamma subunit